MTFPFFFAESVEMSLSVCGFSSCQNSTSDLGCSFLPPAFSTPASFFLAPNESSESSFPRHSSCPFDPQMIACPLLDHAAIK